MDQSHYQTTADALLKKLKTDLEQNQTDKEAVQTAKKEEAAAQRKTYRFKTMSKAEYLEKKKRTAEAETDLISDEALEDLLRSCYPDAEDAADASETVVSEALPEEDALLPDISADEMDALPDDFGLLPTETDIHTENAEIPKEQDETGGEDFFGDVSAEERAEVDSLFSDEEIPAEDVDAGTVTDAAETDAELLSELSDIDDEAVLALLNEETEDTTVAVEEPAAEKAETDVTAGQAPKTAVSEPSQEDDAETEALAAFLNSEEEISGEPSAVSEGDSVPTEAKATAEESAETQTESGKAEAVTDAENAENFDKTDIDLMIAFGMEHEVDSRPENKHTQELKKTIGERKQLHMSEMKKREAPDYVMKRHTEYVSGTQTKEFFAEYKKRYGKLLRRFLCAGVLMLFLFFLENNAMLGIKLSGIWNREAYPIEYTLLDFQLVLLSAVLVWDGIYTGIRSLLRGKPIPESITALVFLFSCIYTGILLLLGPVHDLQLYNFVFPVTVLFELTYEFMNLRREIMSFKIVSSKKLKYAVDAIPKKDGRTERTLFEAYLPDDPTMFRIKRSVFIEGFYQRTDTYPKTQRILRTCIPVSVILSLIFFVLKLFLTGSVYSSLSVAYVALLMILPGSAFLAFSYPMYRASDLSYEKGSALIGEAGLSEYANASVVTFDDKEVFPARGVKMRGIKVFEENRIDHVIYAAASVFHAVGGPLAEVFENASRDLGYSNDVVIVGVKPDGIEANVGGDAVLIGLAPFMNAHGYAVKLTESEQTMQQTGDASVMFIAYHGAVTAKLDIGYTVEKDFEKVLKQLYKQGFCVGIKTSDPNIDDNLLTRKIKMSKYPIRIIKCAEPKENAVIVDRLSSGIVSKTSAKALLQTLAMCERVLRASRTNNIILAVSMILGVLGMAFVVVSGTTLTTAPFWIAMYQLFWMLPMILLARYYI